MKGKLTAIIAGTLFAITGALPASATVKNVNGQHLTSKKQSTLLLAAEVKGNKPSSQSPYLDASAKARARSEAIQSPGYIQRGNQIQTLITQLNEMKPHDFSRVKVRNEMKRLNKEREDIIKHYEDIQRGLQNR